MILPITFATMLALPWQGMGTRRYNWSHDDTVRSLRYESAAVSVVGYLVAVKPEGAESTNCGLTSGDWIDWHMWLVETEAPTYPQTRASALTRTRRF